MARHVMTPARRAALRKAQLTSARKRRKHGLGYDAKRSVKQTVAYTTSSAKVLGSKTKSMVKRHKRGIIYTGIAALHIADNRRYKKFYRSVYKGYNPYRSDWYGRR